MARRRALRLALALAAAAACTLLTCVHLLGVYDEHLDHRRRAARRAPSVARVAPPPGVERTAADRPPTNNSTEHGGSFEVLVRSLARDGALVVSMANSGFAELALHFACGMRRLGRENFLVVALDAEVVPFLAQHGIPSVPAASVPAAELAHVALPGAGAADAGGIANIGGAAFNEICLLKPALILSVLRAGVHAIWSDVDVTWLQDPLPAMVRALEQDEPVVLGGRYVSTMVPPSRPAAAGSAQRRPRTIAVAQYRGHCNAGFMALRASAEAEELMAAMLTCGVRARAYEPEYQNDQAILNDVASGCARWAPVHCGDLARPARIVAMRSRALLPNGDDFWTKRYAHSEHALPFLVHNNRCKQDQKMARMRTAGLWMVREDAGGAPGSGGAQARLACAEPAILHDPAFVSIGATNASSDSERRPAPSHGSRHRRAWSSA